MDVCESAASMIFWVPIGWQQFQVNIARDLTKTDAVGTWGVGAKICPIVHISNMSTDMKGDWRF